jgi:hypothetical protein
MVAYILLMELWGYYFMVSLNASIDRCEMLYSAMVYHWWMLFTVSLA